MILRHLALHLQIRRKEPEGRHRGSFMGFIGRNSGFLKTEQDTGSREKRCSTIERQTQRTLFKVTEYAFMAR